MACLMKGVGGGGGGGGGGCEKVKKRITRPAHLNSLILSKPVAVDYNTLQSCLYTFSGQVFWLQLIAIFV